MIPMDLDFTAKQETDKPSSSSTTTTSWSRLKDPRIVRVSRAFGGKDRHSKVCTVKGLRDRRVRLSVPTAIQLYDLQERLGLNQPSKVVDWLLEAAKADIDLLPPLQQIPIMQNIQNYDPVMKFNDVVVSSSGERNETGSNWSRNDDEEEEITRQYNNFLSRSSSSSVVQNNPASFSSLMNNHINNNNNNNSFLRWEYPSNLTLSQPPVSLGLASSSSQYNGDQDLQNFGHFFQFQPYYFPPPQNNNSASEHDRQNEPRS
ncbi:hypothetical protein ABFS82_11G118300 [Erythranthe guttata]|uniref:TCP domain-containing protein n=1 Tax=Erythranthe guttata TaxID=4155 RepID=A0A022R306_ERYGU|nr:PREDICTED: transcription factor TCP24-like [Erythranthe guttata]EYU34601.1 hypothetical protein MIMGU_mgv1a012180mg [Erythranthe guttata]|eukprot:XP_012840515.1 PREDICTED: transcription factor TCP24-like [Erythranthe guttata]